MSKQEEYENDLKHLYKWLMDDNREPAQTKFTSGMLRNVAKEIEFRLREEVLSDMMKEERERVYEEMSILIDNSMNYYNFPDKDLKQILKLNNNVKL